MSTGRWVPHPIEGMYAVRDLATDELLRGWRKGTSHLIWRGTLEEATGLCALMEKDGPPREELDQTQRIHFMNVKRRSARIVTRSPFSKCTKCGNMVKSEHEC